MNEISYVGWMTATIFIVVQLCYFVHNCVKLNRVKLFFKHREKYKTTGIKDDILISEHICYQNSMLLNLITELNEFLSKNHGTADFSIIQNKTERKIESQYEDAISRISFPIYIGLMGTFAGVFIGLYLFKDYLSTSGTGVTDAAIGSLIKGVLVSMSTSFMGLLLTTISHHMASNVRKAIDIDKNEFFDFIQTELMPALGVSMVAALNKLHNTIVFFEPAFNSVIDKFQESFDRCTSRFGSTFEENVTIVAKAVDAMGKNMNSINTNIELNQKLIKTMESSKMSHTLKAFTEAATKYEDITSALAKFERIINSISATSEELVRMQSNYNESLEIPKEIVKRLNSILDRITNFEENISGLGEQIKGNQWIGNTVMEDIQQQLNAIKSKQKMAEQYIDIADNHIADMYREETQRLSNLNKLMESRVIEYGDDFVGVLEKISKELAERRREIMQAFEEKFSLSSLQKEFENLSYLSKMEPIEKELLKIGDNNSSKTIEYLLSSLKNELVEIKRSIGNYKEELIQQEGFQENQSFFRRFLKPRRN